VANNTWNIYKQGLQAKQARFDILGNMYYLGADDCVHQASDDKTLVCDVMDFEVTADKKVYVLVPPNSPADNSDEFVLNTTSSTYY